MLLDLARYWLMQWHLVVLLSLGGWLTKQLFRCIEKQHSPSPGVRISIDYGFQFHYIQKHIGLGPGNNLIAVYFFLYLIVISSNSILFFSEVPTITYYFLVSKLCLEFDLQNTVWVFFFRCAPFHPYLLLLVYVDCLKTIVQSIDLPFKMAPLKILLTGAAFLTNRCIALRCTMQSLYLPFLWRITIVPEWKDVYLANIAIESVTSESYLSQIFGWSCYLCVNLAFFCCVADPVYKRTESIAKEVDELTEAYNRQLQQLHREWQHQDIVSVVPLQGQRRRLALKSHFRNRAAARLLENTPSVPSTVPPYVPPLISAESSDEECAAGYHVGKYVLRTRKPFVKKMRNRNDNFELPGYNEDEDSTYFRSQMTYDSDSDSSAEEMSKAECNLYNAVDA